jgi:site-specific DNA recombinase
MSKRAGIYCRMSKSKGDIKIEQQEAACRKLAAAHDLEVVDVYVDDGISAYTGKVRPDWTRLLEDVQAGRLDVLLAQSEDRFTRQPMEKETLLIACVAKGVEWLTVNDGRVDPATADGQFFSVLRAGLARMESTRKGERQRQSNDHRAASGMVRVGGPRPLGWDKDKVTLEPAEAKELRWAIDQVLAGASVFSIVRRWNDIGFVSSKGQPWQTVTVKQVLTRSRMAGLVTHRGEIVQGIKAEWETICTPEEWRDACTILNSKKQPQNNREPKWLLSGIAKCECGLPMRYARNGSNQRAYRCFAKIASLKPDVQHVTIAQDQADHRAIEGVISALLFSGQGQTPDPDAAALADLHDGLRKVNEARARLADAVAADVLTLQEVAVRKASLVAEATETEAAIAAITARNAQAALMHEAKAGLWSGPKVSIMEAAKVKADLRKRFEGLSLEQKRGLIRGLVDVVVHRGRGSERVEVTHLVATSLNEQGDPVGHGNDTPKGKYPTAPKVSCTPPEH